MALYVLYIRANITTASHSSPEVVVVVIHSNYYYIISFALTFNQQTLIIRNLKYSFQTV